ncbi:MAG: hypothetical protein ACLR6J_17815 [Parabacteroides merdae]
MSGTPGLSGFREVSSLKEFDTCPFQLGGGLQEISGVGPKPGFIG